MPINLIDSAEVQYWIKVYPTIFSIFILLISVFLTIPIKGWINKILSILTLNGVIAFALNWFVFGKSYIGFTRKNFLIHLYF